MLMYPRLFGHSCGDCYSYHIATMKALFFNVKTYVLSIHMKTFTSCKITIINDYKNMHTNYIQLTDITWL